MLVAISSYPVLKPLEKINTKDYLSSYRPLADDSLNDKAQQPSKCGRPSF